MKQEYEAAIQVASLIRTAREDPQFLGRIVLMRRLTFAQLSVRALERFVRWPVGLRSGLITVIGAPADTVRCHFPSPSPNAPSRHPAVRSAFGRPAVGEVRRAGGHPRGRPPVARGAAPRHALGALAARSTRRRRPLQNARHFGDGRSHRRRTCGLALARRGPGAPLGLGAVARPRALGAARVAPHMNPTTAASPVRRRWLRRKRPRTGPPPGRRSASQAPAARWRR